jgi:hypothetical protein
MAASLSSSSSQWLAQLGPLPTKSHRPACQLTRPARGPDFDLSGSFPPPPPPSLFLSHMCVLLSAQQKKKKNEASRGISGGQQRCFFYLSLYLTHALPPQHVDVTLSRTHTHTHQAVRRHTHTHTFGPPHAHTLCCSITIFCFSLSKLADARSLSGLVS